jgi:glycosyltransferase involved in cell wall biosynthesis
MTLLKICVVSQQLKKTISGIGLHTNNLVRSLLKDGHEVHVIAPDEQRPDGPLQYGFTGVKAPIFRRNQARWISLSFRFGQALRELNGLKRFDLVHFTDARESLFCPKTLPSVGNINDTYSAQLHAIGYYRKYYADWLTRSLYYRFVHTCESFALPRLDAVIANRQFTADVIADQYRVRPEKLFICHKSIDVSLYRPALEARKINAPHPPRILFVGTNMQRKGLPVIIQAMPALTSVFPNAELWVIGEDKVIPRMKALAEEFGVSSNIHFLGWKSQHALIDIYACSDVFVMPSLTEAFGVVFLEAMASGVIAVGARVGGIPEIIEERVSGRLLENNDPQALGKILTDIFMDPHAQKLYRKRGLEKVESFSVEKMMACTYNIYESVISGRM